MADYPLETAPRDAPVSQSPENGSGTGRKGRKKAKTSGRPAAVLSLVRDDAPDKGLRGQKRMAYRFARQFAGQFIHTPGRGWMEFNGAHWEECGEARPWQAVHEVCLDALRELPEVPRTDHRDALYKDIRYCDSADGTAGVLKHARNWPGIARRDEELDQHAHLFVCRNGTYDLAAGEFRPSDPADLMTLAAGVSYDPYAECPLYDELLATYQPDEGVRAYLHRLAGAAMEGRQNLQQVIINYGQQGGNGKGTIQRAWWNVFGQYASELDIGVLLPRKGYDQYRDAKAMLQGKRIVLITEPSEGQRFDTGTVKSLTGGERVTAARKYKSETSFHPTWLLIMNTNNRVRTPKDGGMARRLKEIGWHYTVPEGEQRHDLDAILAAEGAGILNRIIEGWRDFAENGDQEPESVKKATADYLASVDPVAQFLEALVGPKEGNNVPSRSMYEAYKTWCIENGEKPKAAKEFSPELERHGLVRKRESRGVLWLDVCLMADDDGEF